MAAIRTPDRRVRVFISSTLGELADERAATREAIEKLHLVPVLFELGARPHPPRALYRAYLDQSDVFVGIYWERYGWTAPGEDISGLEDEYRLATDRLPQLVYIKEPSPSRERLLDDLLQRIQSDDRLAYRRFSSAAELAQLVADDLAVLLSERFQPEGAGAERRAFGGPPMPLDRTFGRDHDVAAVVGLLRDGHRLVSLTGAGGIGKTRLAIQVARELQPDYEDAVVFVPLSDLTDPDRVLSALADRMGISLGGVGDLVDELVAELSRRPTMLVFDNFEHLASAAPQIATLLERCPDAVALVTSRHVLRVHGERDYPVAPLDESAASALFAERSTAVRPSFRIADDNRDAIAKIVRQLDGLPLAIELAAACMRVYTPAKLLDELSRRMDLLTRGATDVAERQRTLRATMDWSFDLLDEAERRVFERLAVFNGSFSLDAVEAICHGVDDSTVLESMAGLVEKSLVVVMDDSTGDPRFRMLESIRAYATEKLLDSPARAETEQRHTDWMFRLLLERPDSLPSPHHQTWLEHFDLDHANLRGAVERALKQGDAATVANLVRASIGYLSLRDSEAEAAGWLEAALPFAAEGPALVRTHLLLARSALLGGLGNYEEARQLLDDARHTGAPLDDPFDAALAAMAEAIVVSAEQQSEVSLAAVLNAAAALQSIGSDVGPAYMWQTAGTIALSCAPDCADAYLSNALELIELMDNDGLRGQVLTLLGYSARRAGRSDEARERFIAAAEAALRSGQRSSMAYALDGLAAEAVDMGTPELAALSLGCSTYTRADLERTSWASFRPLIDEVAESARDALGEETFTTLHTDGSRLDVHEALRDALHHMTNEPSEARDQ